MEKEKYENPEVTVLNDKNSEIKPQPLGIFAGIVIFVMAAFIHQVAGLIDGHVHVNLHTTVNYIS